MNNVSFATLLIIYQNTNFREHGELDDNIQISTPEIRDALQKIEEDNSGNTGITVNSDDDNPIFEIGQSLKLDIRSPRIGLGCFARTFSEFLRFTDANIIEPRNYFIVEGKVSKLHTKGDDTRTGASPLIQKYIKLLGIINIFSESSVFLDKQRGEIVFFKDRKISVPIRYSENDLKNVSEDDCDRFLSYFNDDLHREEKLSILSCSVFRIADSQPLNERFQFLIKNIDTINKEIKEGYNLYVSSFSYEKIRNEVDSARLEYIGKIQKTLTDIQAQLLGIPISTVVVASQFKEVKKCGGDFWTNSAVIAGCWIFIAVLWLTLRNQKTTLNGIKKEIERQRDKLKENYSNVVDNFTDSFNDLFCRIKKVKIVLFCIFAISIFGAVGANYIYIHITGVNYKTCVLFYTHPDSKKESNKSILMQTFSST